MRFWDSSAIVPLLIEQLPTPLVMELYALDRSLAVWWSTDVECASAIARLERDGATDSLATQAALDRLASLAADWLEVEARDPVRRTAIRLLRTHALRAADALQLSAALALADHDPSRLDFVTLDRQLAEAADREGLKVVVPA